MDEINPRSAFMRFYEAEMKELLRDMKNIGVPREFFNDDKADALGYSLRRIIESNNSSREPQAALLSSQSPGKKPKKECSCFR